MRTINYVFISSPYSIGDREENVMRQIVAAEELTKHHFIPFSPLLYHYWHKEYPHKYEFWMSLSLLWIERCDAVLRLPGESHGGDREVKRAKRLGIPVFYSINELLVATEAQDVDRI